jgi:uncharacterized damage-inducible protein DinB
METDFANIEGMFNTNTELVGKALQEVPAEHWFRAPGNDSNHLMWVAGHLVVHRAAVLKYLGADWEASWSPLFKRGAQRTADEEYPSIEEIRSAWQAVSEKLLNLLASPPAEELSKTAEAGPPSFDGKMSGQVAFFAFHETYHTGQVSYLKKWLGYGQTVG